MKLSTLRIPLIVLLIICVVAFIIVLILPKDRHVPVAAFAEHGGVPSVALALLHSCDHQLNGPVKSYHTENKHHCFYDEQGRFQGYGQSGRQLNMIEYQGDTFTLRQLPIKINTVRSTVSFIRECSPSEPNTPPAHWACGAEGYEISLNQREGLVTTTIPYKGAPNPPQVWRVDKELRPLSAGRQNKPFNQHWQHLSADEYIASYHLKHAGNSDDPFASVAMIETGTRCAAYYFEDACTLEDKLEVTQRDAHGNPTEIRRTPLDNPSNETLMRRIYQYR